MKKKFIKQKGITLIALIITVICLLILAGISISALFGDNGLLNKSTGTKEEYSKAEVKEKVSLILSEYLIENLTEGDTDFAKFLRKNLQVGVSKNEGSTYSFLLGEWQVITTENKVINIEKFKLDIWKAYPSVASMKADIGLTEGKLVRTEGYWSKNYGGSAYYDIVSSTSLTVDNGKCIQLDNGLYAELHAINDTVTVNQFGAYGDGEHDDATAIEATLNAGYENITFESERYKQNASIKIKNNNVNLIGNGTNIFNESDYIVEHGGDYHFFIIGTSDNWIKNIDIMCLNMESSKASDISEIQFGAKYVENVSIWNCNFIINEIEEHKTTGNTNIWFHTGWKNISINSCKVINYGKTELGGSIYFSDELGNKCENLVITNCYVDEKSGDESIAFWGDDLSNIRFKNNTVMDNNDNKHNSMLIRIGTINNVSIYNNNLETTSYGSLIKIGKR